MRINTDAQPVQFAKANQPIAHAKINNNRSTIAVCSKTEEAKAAEKKEAPKATAFQRFSKAVSEFTAWLADAICCCFSRALPSKDAEEANKLLDSNEKSITPEQLKTLSATVNRAVAKELKANPKQTIREALVKVLNKSAVISVNSFAKSWTRMNDKALVQAFNELPRCEVKGQVLVQTGIARAARLGGMLHRVDAAMTFNATRAMQAREALEATKTKEEFKANAADLRSGINAVAKEQNQKAQAEAQAAKAEVKK